MTSPDTLDQKIRSLVVQLIESAPPGPPLPDAGAVSRRRARRRRHRSGLAGALVLAVTLIAVGLVVPALARPGRAPAEAVVAPKWVLISDVNLTWTEAPGQAPGVPINLSLTCPSATTCYAAGPGGTQITTDAGKTWRALVSGSSLAVGPVSCLSARTCAVLGVGRSLQPLFLETTDSGRTWTSVAGPAGLSGDYGWTDQDIYPDGPIDLSCVTAASCVVTATNGGADCSSPAVNCAPSLVFVTTNGGRTWSEGAPPPGYVPVKVRCFSGGKCISTGGARGGAAVYSSDDGVTWSLSSMPPGLGLVGALSCSEATNCMAAADPEYAPPSAPSVILVSHNDGRLWSSAPSRGLDLPVTGLSCPISSQCWASGGAYSLAAMGGKSLEGTPAAPTAAGLVLTTDGGQTWQTARLPKGVTGVDAVSCPSTTTCFALGSVPSALPSSAPPGAVLSGFVLLEYRA